MSLYAAGDPFPHMVLENLRIPRMVLEYINMMSDEIGDVVLSDQLLSLHKRDQNDPEILERRVLHRITFKISNLGKPTWIQQQNKGCNNE